MALVEAVKTKENSYTAENAMDALLSKLDEALDDVEHRRMLDEAELWDEIDAVWEWVTSIKNHTVHILPTYKG